MIGIFQGRGIADRARVHAQIDVDMREHLHAFNNGKNLNALAVFMDIALHANEGGWAWPGRAKMKKHTGIKTEAALTSALRWLRGVKINGQRIFAHYRQRVKGKWGRSAYLIFPDLIHPDPPYPDMYEYDPTHDDPLVDDPLTDDQSHEAEPWGKENQVEEETNTPAASAAESPGPLPDDGFPCCNHQEIYLADHATGRVVCRNCGSWGHLLDWPPPPPPPEAPPDGKEPPGNLPSARTYVKTKAGIMALSDEDFDATLASLIAESPPVECMPCPHVEQRSVGVCGQCWRLKLSPDSFTPPPAPCPDCGSTSWCACADSNAEPCEECGSKSAHRDTCSRKNAGLVSAPRSPGWREQAAEAQGYPHAEELERALRRFGDRAGELRGLAVQLWEAFALELPVNKKRHSWWVGQLDELYQAAGGDWALVKEAGRRLREGGCTLSSPGSLIKTVEGIKAERAVAARPRATPKADAQAAAISTRMRRKPLAAPVDPEETARLRQQLREHREQKEAAA